MTYIRRIQLLDLEALVGELEGAAVFGNGADNVVGHAIGHFGVHFERDFHFCANQPREMRYHFFGDLTRIATDARGV